MRATTLLNRSLDLIGECVPSRRPGGRQGVHQGMPGLGPVRSGLVEFGVGAVECVTCELVVAPVCMDGGLGAGELALARFVGVA